MARPISYQRGCRPPDRVCQRPVRLGLRAPSGRMGRDSSLSNIKRSRSERRRSRSFAPCASRLRLSPRELQITRCVFDDLTDMAIAAELGIGVNTVHSHFERLYHKLAVHSRAALVVRVFQEYVSQQPDSVNGVRHPEAFAGDAPSKAHSHNDHTPRRVRPLTSDGS